MNRSIYFLLLYAANPDVHDVVHMSIATSGRVRKRPVGVARQRAGVMGSAGTTSRGRTDDFEPRVCGTGTLISTEPRTQMNGLISLCTMTKDWSLLAFQSFSEFCAFQCQNICTTAFVVVRSRNSECNVVTFLFAYRFEAFRRNGNTPLRYIGQISNAKGRLDFRCRRRLMSRAVLGDMAAALLHLIDCPYR